MSLVYLISSSGTSVRWSASQAAKLVLQGQQDHMHGGQICRLRRGSRRGYQAHLMHIFVLAFSAVPRKPLLSPAKSSPCRLGKAPSIRAGSYSWNADSKCFVIHKNRCCSAVWTLDLPQQARIALLRPSIPVLS